MSEQKWEYCKLGLWSAKKHRKGKSLLSDGKFVGWGYDCGISYCNSDGETGFRELAALDTVLPYNPFLKAMGLLGGGGWELVSVQHGLSIGRTDMEVDHGKVRWESIVAYFKRPVVPGRAVDEPKLELDNEKKP